MEQLLRQLGLGDGEIAVYLNLLERPEASVAQLMAATQLRRGDTYNKLYALAERGLVREFAKDKKKYFRAEDPRKLEEAVTEQDRQLHQLKAELGAALPDLVSRYTLTQHRPGVSVFEGREAIARVFEHSLGAKTRIDSYLDGESVLEYFPKENAAYVRKRERLGIKKRILIAQSEASQRFVKEGYRSDLTEYRHVRFPAGRFHAVMQIYDDTVSYLTFKPEAMIGIIIQDPLVAALHRNVFALTWELSAQRPPSRLGDRSDPGGRPS